MRKAVGYYRVSTDQQRKTGLGLAAQKNQVRPFCKHNNFRLVREFVEVQSGENTRRKKMQLAIGYCLEHDAVLIVAKQCRLARNVFFIANLIKKGPSFISVNSPSADKLQKHIQAAFDEQYLDEVRRNTTLSLRVAVRKWIRLGPNSQKLKRTLQRKRKAYLKKVSIIFKKLFIELQTVRAITDELNRMKVKTYRGKKGGWHISTVHKTLRDLSLIK